MPWRSIPRGVRFGRSGGYAITRFLYSPFASCLLNLTSTRAVLNKRPPGPGGGIGRRAGFRCQWLHGREGSSPFLGTISPGHHFAWMPSRCDFGLTARSPLSNLGGSLALNRFDEVGKIMTVRLHRGDLPDLTRYTDSVAIDTETMGLHPHRDRLCVVQMSNGDGSADVVQVPKDHGQAPNDAPHLKALLADSKITKIFHFARFDLAALY